MLALRLEIALTRATRSVSIELRIIPQRRTRRAGFATILNVASGQARRVGDVLTELAALAGVELGIKVDESRIRATDIRRACGNASRAHELLDWSPAIPWAQTLQDVLIDWRGRVDVERI